MTVKKVLYSAPSRLVGHRLKVRFYSETLECWLGNVGVLELQRGQPDAANRRGKVVNYRHLLLALWRAWCCAMRCSHVLSTARCGNS